MLLGLVAAVCSSTVTAAPFSQASGFLFEFGVPRITGIPEHAISDYGCPFLVKESSFFSVLKRPPYKGMNGYAPLDVRAKVLTTDGRTYYIDHNGIVRSGQKYFVVDTVTFSKLVKARCPVEQKSADYRISPPTPINTEEFPMQ